MDLEIMGRAVGIVLLYFYRLRYKNIRIELIYKFSILVSHHLRIQTTACITQYEKYVH